MEITATLRDLHIAPRKVRLAAGVLYGMEVERAELELAHRAKRATPVLLKLLRSAAADARHNFHLESATLKIKEVRVNPGSVSKRFRARAFGRAAPIRRRTSHVILVLETAGKGRGTSWSRAPTAAPTVREATAEDVRGSAAPGRSAFDAGEKIHKQSKKWPGFMRRVFQRKAI